jgi:hypothetical protein
MEPLETTPIPWAQGVAGSTPVAPTNGFNQLPPLSHHKELACDNMSTCFFSSLEALCQNSFALASVISGLEPLPLPISTCV